MKKAALFLFVFVSIFVPSLHAFCEEFPIQELSPYSGVEGLSFTNDILSLKSTSPMPLLMTKDNIFVNASRFKLLEIKMKSDKSYMTGRIFFRRIGDPGFNYYNSFQFQTGLNNMYHDYLIDLGRNPNWFGTVLQIMFSPINGDGLVEVKDIKFLEPNMWAAIRSSWQEFFTFERPAPRTVNFIYGPKINGISVNTYIYSLIFLISLLLILFYWIKLNDLGKLLNITPLKIIMICFIFWLLLDARTAVDQLRSAIIDHQTFGGKSFEEKQALSTSGSFNDFYYYLRFCGEKIPHGSTYSLVVGPSAIYFIDKSRYYLYPTYEDTMEAEYVLVYDPQKTLKADEIPGKGFKKFADFGENQYILKKVSGI